MTAIYSVCTVRITEKHCIAIIIDILQSTGRNTVYIASFSCNRTVFAVCTVSFQTVAAGLYYVVDGR